MSAKHLDRAPWLVNTRQSLQANYWRFEFEASPMKDRFGVSGNAYPSMDKIPEWAGWIEELWLMAYLCDSRGRVIAKDLQVTAQLLLTPAEGVRFTFVLQPEDLGRQGQLYLSFGYRMVLAENRRTPDTAQGEANVFFANEGALTIP